MNKNTQCTMLSIIFLLATAWNILCLTSILPLKFYYLSVIVVILITVLNNFVFYRASEQGQSKDKEKVKLSLFGIFMCLGLAWLITSSVCMVCSR